VLRRSTDSGATSTRPALGREHFVLKGGLLLA
jgi:hypothetical protein